MNAMTPFARRITAAPSPCLRGKTFRKEGKMFRKEGNVFRRKEGESYSGKEGESLRWTSAHPRICVDEHVTNSRVSVRDVWTSSY